jgi:TatD DNase family protein
MIDVHCHLEQKDYQKDRDKVVENCKKELKAIITCCTKFEDLKLTLDLIDQYKNFVFGSFAIHPLHIQETDKETLEKFFSELEKNREKIVGIGETGLDFIIENENLRQRQREIFKKFIQFAKDLDLPLVIHSRKATKEAFEILDKAKPKKVLFHFFTEKSLLPKVLENNWSISVNTALRKSKKIKKIVRDVKIKNLMTETDAPWLGENNQRNDPLSIKLVVEEIAKIKKMEIEKVDTLTTQNAIEFFNLKLT